MKKNQFFKVWIAGIVLLGLMLQVGMAQVELWPRHKSQSFIPAGIQSITSSNAVGITNLALPGVTGTNWLNTIWTNGAGRVVVSTASTYTNVNLLSSVELWALADGSVPIAFNSTNGMLAGYAAVPGLANISYSISAGAAANTANTFIFKPSWDGTNVDTTGNFDFTFAVTPTASGTINSSTNVPLYKWIGAKRLFCAVWLNGDTDATGLATLRSLKFNGFGPP